MDMEQKNKPKAANNVQKKIDIKSEAIAKFCVLALFLILYD